MLRKFRETLKNKQRGAIMVFFAILVPLFLGAIGLAVDAGFLYMQKARLQDVADATALAGAGHLNDGNDRDGQVASAVVAFAGANGYKDYATSSNFSPLGDKVPDSSVTLEENAAWKIAYAIDTGMKDKDAKNGELRDHVRVVILKRVPTFFIRMLFPEQKEVVVKAVAAAEYVAGEEPVVSGGAKIICGNFAPENVYNNKTMVVSPGQDFSFYSASSGGAGIYAKLPEGSVGTVYNVNEYWDTLPKGWNLVRLKNNWINPSDDELKEMKAAEEMNRKREKYLHDIKNEIESTKIQDYVDGIGKKRFIGRYNNQWINNIKEGDAGKDIELYMSGTAVSEGWFREGCNFLTDAQLGKIKKINKLFSDKWLVIGTKNIEFGDIYDIKASGICVGGKKNSFKGTVYTGGQLLIGGVDNHFVMGNKPSIICEQTLHIGRWNMLTDIDNGRTIEISGEIRENNDNFHVYFDSSSGGSSSGSSGSGASKAHVRLVI